MVGKHVSDSDTEDPPDRLAVDLHIVTRMVRFAAGTRRQVLKVLTAGAMGVIAWVVLPLRRTIGNISDDDNSAGVDENESDGAGRGGEFSYDVFVFERDGEYEAATARGERIDAGDDGWDVLENGIDAVPDGGSIFVRGEYEGASTLEIDKSIRMFGSEADISYQEAGDFVFHFQGNERRQTTLTATADTGDNTIELEDTEGMQKGDMVLLEEEDGETLLGRGQPPGEPHSVLEVEDGTVRLEDSIVWRDGYPSGTLVYLIDPIEVHCEGFSLEAPAKDRDYVGMVAQDCRDSTFVNLRFDKFGNRAIMLESCANTRVRDCKILQSSDIESGNGYGVQVWAGCHDIIVEGCVAKECRHPLSVTPGGPREVASRAVIFRDCSVSSEGSAALNCHGGSAHDVRFEGCIVHTWGDVGVRTGAQATVVTGCEFRMDGHNAVGTRNDGQEMILTVTDVDVYGAGRAVHLDREEDSEFDPLWKLVQLEGVRAHGCNRFFELESGEIDRVRNLAIKDCYWDEVTEEGLRIRNRIDGGIIEGNDFGGAPNDIHIHARDNASTQVTNLHIADNRFRQPSGTDAFIRLNNSEQCVVSDNKFEAGSDVNIYVDDENATGNLIKQNTYAAPNPSADPVAEADGSLAADNYVYDTDEESWL